MNNYEKFKNLLVFPKHLFEKWKKNIEIDQKLSHLDKEMQNIMKRNDLNDYQKWNLYRYQLIKFKRNKKNPIKSAIVNNPATFTQKKILRASKPTRKTVDSSIQTENDFLPKKIDSETQTAPSYLHNNSFKEDIFENVSQEIENYNGQPLFSSSFIEPNENELMDFSIQKSLNFNPGEEYNFDEDLEAEINKIAQKELNAQHPNDIVRRDYSLGKDYRSFDNKLTGENITIDVSPIKKMLNASLYNDSATNERNQISDRVSVENNPKPVLKKKSRAIKILEPAITYQLRSQFKKDLPPKLFAEEEIIRKLGKRSQFDWINT